MEIVEAPRKIPPCKRERVSHSAELTAPHEVKAKKQKGRLPFSAFCLKWSSHHSFSCNISKGQLDAQLVPQVLPPRELEDEENFWVISVFYVYVIYTRLLHVPDDLNDVEIKALIYSRASLSIIYKRQLHACCKNLARLQIRWNCEFT